MDKNIYAVDKICTEQNYNRCGWWLSSSSLQHFVFKHLVRFSIQSGPRHYAGAVVCIEANRLRTHSNTYSYIPTLRA